MSPEDPEAWLEILTAKLRRLEVVDGILEHVPGKLVAEVLLGEVDDAGLDRHIVEASVTLRQGPRVGTSLRELALLCLLPIAAY